MAQRVSGGMGGMRTRKKTFVAKTAEVKLAKSFILLRRRRRMSR